MTFAVKPNLKMTTTYLEPKNLANYLSHDNVYCLFLDIDGTLAQFTLDPKDSFIPQSTLTLIQKIQNSGIQIAIVTGRSLFEAKQMVSPLQLPIAATHGLEIDCGRYQDKVNSSAKDSAFATDADRNSAHLSAVTVDTSELNRIRQQIIQSCLPYNDFTIENKPYSCALHYRQDPSLAEVAYRIMAMTITEDSAWTLKQGKYVWEAVPKGVDKGTAILTLLKLMQHDAFDTFDTFDTFKGKRLCPIFIGDDITDEAGFIVVQDENSLAELQEKPVKGLGIKVGSEPTAAHYYVNDIDEVAILLESFLTFCQGQTATVASWLVTETDSLDAMTTDHTTDNNTANPVL